MFDKDDKDKIVWLYNLSQEIVHRLFDYQSRITCFFLELIKVKSKDSIHVFISFFTVFAAPYNPESDDEYEKVSDQKIHVHV